MTGALSLDRVDPTLTLLQSDKAERLKAKEARLLKKGTLSHTCSASLQLIFGFVAADCECVTISI